jgi:acyl-lipid omega-6 desaturase (Delta-12 desaturase)
MRAGTRPPRSADLYHLQPGNLSGAVVCGGTVAATAAGIWLSSHDTGPRWAVGQIVLAVAFVEWFVLLHECGHDTLFRTRALHRPVGYVAGFFALIPFECWRRIHARHHRWTGWQDLDPTTVALTPRPRSRFERRAVNVCWKYWIPLFSTMYRVDNFWNLPRLMRLFQSDRSARRGFVANATVQAVAYLLAAFVVGPQALARSVGAALVLAFMIEDVLLLSQHTHVPMGLSHGRSVEPYRALAQEPFTRSLRLPAWLSRVWLHFDAHELHHMYPFVPGYRLNEVPYAAANEVSWRQWVPAARAIPGEVFLFQNRNESGFDV